LNCYPFTDLSQQINRFFAYEEYGAKYEMMVKDVASTHRTLPQWDVYQKGVEALAATLSSINNQQERARKGFTVGDLLIKVSHCIDYIYSDH
jgi:hypothetical protein